MQSAQLINQGLELALIGMGTVFLFLTLLIIATGLMSRAASRWAPEELARSTGPGSPPQDDEQVVAVISAALRQHRQRRDHG